MSVSNVLGQLAYCGAATVECEHLEDDVRRIGSTARSS